MRYLAVDDAEHACCFGACVVDKEQPNKWADTTETNPMSMFRRICECHNFEEATMIANALNGAK